MKQCNRAEEHFSACYDNQLSPDEEAQLEQHLAACSDCREAYARFEAALSRLRLLKVATTPSEYAAQVSAAVYAQSPRAEIAAGSRRRRLTLLLLSHAAALLLGLSFVFFAGRPASDDAPSNLLAQREAPDPIIIQVPVEVPVERRVEVRVEVPVEVVKEVVVERVEYVDRPVPNPLQRSIDQQQAFAADLAGALHESLLLARLSKESAAREAELRSASQALADELLANAALARNRASAPLVVLREDDHVRIRTRGEAADVVPALIAVLDGPDRELAAAAEQQLSSIRSRMAEQAGVDANSASAQTNDGQPSESGFKAWLRKHGPPNGEQPAPPVSPRERWQEWWNGRSLAQAQSGAS